MIAVDTNIVIRFLTHDDENQFKKAVKLFEQEKLFLPDTVLLETAWVLGYAYQYESHHVAEAFKNLLGLPNVEVRDGWKLAQVIEWYEKGLDFADAFHLADSRHVEHFITFDRQFVKRAKGLGDCPVKQPHH